MTYDEKTSRPQTPHHIILEGRSALSVSGVEEVERFDETEIVMYTSRGTLVVRGEGLHIEKLSLDGGDLKVMGTVDAMAYEDEEREKGGLFSRLFR
jgi:sporulation protein YabP